MESYENTRLKYKPTKIKILLIAESPPPKASIESNRHFYRADKARVNDRLFINTVRAIYDIDEPGSSLEQNKRYWLNKLQNDGIYLIEALSISLPHEVSKQERRTLIKNNLPTLIKRVSHLAKPNTKIILIKSNVFDVAAEPLREAGFNVLNKELVDYPGQYNQQTYIEKLKNLL